MNSRARNRRRSVARGIPVLFAVFVARAHTAQAGINVWTSHGPGVVQIAALAIDPTTPRTLYAGIQGEEAGLGVYKGTDGASSWQAVNAGLSNTPISALAIDPTTPRTLYAGTAYDGVFKSTDGAGSWHAVNAGLPNGYSVVAFGIDPMEPRRVYAGTGGRGVFSIEQLVVCVGDCGASDSVIVADVITLVNIALGAESVTACAAGDANDDGAIMITEIVQSVQRALHGCPIAPGACSSIAGLPCGAGAICDLRDLTCSVADLTGTCVPGPLPCPAGYAPVCGCDAVTYANDCARLNAGATLAYAGKCVGQP